MRSVRRVRRVLRKIDPWTMFKFAAVFNAVAGLVFFLGWWVMWSVAVQRGIPEGIADVFESLTLSYTPDGDLYLRIMRLLTIVWWVIATAAMTLGAVVYNLISDLVGGIEYDVLEETFVPDKRRWWQQLMGPNKQPSVPASKSPVPPAAVPPAEPSPAPVSSSTP